MKVSFSRSRTSTAGKISAELEEKRFDHDDSTSLCHSKILTAMKRWIPFVFNLGPVPEFLLVHSAARRFSMAVGFCPDCFIY